MTEIPATMKRIVKEPGVGNIQVVDDEVPRPGPGEVLVRVHRSLISRGSEIGGRFRKEDAVSPEIMGYSAAGEVVSVGESVSRISVGQRVVVVAPHAEFVIGDTDAIAARAVTLIPDSVSFDQAVFHPLATGAVLWAEVSAISTDDDVVVMGLGLVGNLVLQAVGEYRPRQLIGIDALSGRCDLATHVGASATIDVSTHDPVEEVRNLTSNAGASLVMECVGGPAGVRSFEQAVRMTRRLGRIHLIALYHEGRLQLDSQAIQQRTIIGGYFTELDQTWRPAADKAMKSIANSSIQVEPLITHHFSPNEAPAAFDILHNYSHEAFGVIFDWT